MIGQIEDSTILIREMMKTIKIDAREYMKFQVGMGNAFKASLMINLLYVNYLFFWICLGHHYEP